MTDTPQQGDRSTMLSESMFYAETPTPQRKKGKDVSVMV
jgi:hypothetical protein